ncbi:sulfur carrier protein ThiS [Parasedimentitalea maritima]|uniref:Sulfur carrier protein ThiS n=1 Tax=Parasedimentitalea maritima TaxID=2578117 RepID=A0A6A4RJD0_9RHOB|nr:sulfur carrier protein ThiS [Zongyanglinia marina]KAE9629403.1 sulfur carrier protein ThiS [Zongyanglinia marina]
MKITVNAQDHEVASTTLAAVLLELEITKPTIATALNSVFVPREERPATTLSEGDRIEILAPMQGG